MNEMFNVTSTCPLCEEQSLHVIGKDEQESQQCINCGFATANRFKGFMDETNEAYSSLPDELKKWAKYENGMVWIPTVMALPIGLLHPTEESNVMKWAFASMVEISEEEKENYSDGKGGYYKNRIDVENELVFNTFIEAMAHVNDNAKENKPKESKINLPKLKKK